MDSSYKKNGDSLRRIKITTIVFLTRQNRRIMAEEKEKENEEKEKKKNAKRAKETESRRKDIAETLAIRNEERRLEEINVHR